MKNGYGNDTTEQEHAQRADTKKELNRIQWLSGGNRKKRPPALLAVTPPRTGEHTLLGVENLLGSIAVPEPFSLELAGDGDGVTLMARCLDEEVVRQQIAAHYPQAGVHDAQEEEDPLRLAEGEQAWGMTLRSGGPEYAPLRVFRDDDLLDPGSDPLISLLGALSALRDGERVVARLLLRSLGPDWSESHLAKAMQRPGSESRLSADAEPARATQTDVTNMMVLGVGALAVLQGYLWVEAGETWKAVLLGVGVAVGLALAGWAWHRWKKAHSRVYDPLLIREKVSHIAFDAELQVTAIMPQDDQRRRARELLGPVAAAYRHYDHPARARFKVGVVPSPVLHPTGPGLFGKRSVPDCAVFADTHWEPPSVYAHLDWLANQLRFPLHVVDNGRSLREDVKALVNHSGSRNYVDIPVYLKGSDGHGDGIGQRQRTEHYRIVTVRRKVRELLGLAKGQRVPAETVVEL